MPQNRLAAPWRELLGHRLSGAQALPGRDHQSRYS
jgi:hypothetical protein